MGPVVEIGCMRPLTSLMSIGKSIADNRRRQGRIRVHGIGTSLGKVLDVSAGGARLRAGLSQSELADRMGTSQSTIARLESGQTLPSTKTLLRYAEATGSRFHVRLSAA